MNKCIYCGETIENSHGVIYLSGYFCNSLCIQQFILSKKDLIENWTETETIAKQANLGDRLKEEELTKLGFVITDIIFGKLGHIVTPGVLHELIKEILQTLGIDSKKVAKFSEKYR